jgi:hypothetical protein
VVGEARFARKLLQVCSNGSKNASFEIRKASAPDSPVPGEHTDV